MNDFNRRVTGKKVLADAATLVKDTGIFIVDLGRLLLAKLKKLAENDKSEKTPAAASE